MVNGVMAGRPRSGNKGPNKGLSRGFSVV